MRRALVAATIIGGAAAFWACGFSVVGIERSTPDGGGGEETGPNLPEAGPETLVDTGVVDGDAEASLCEDAAGNDPLNCGACGRSCQGTVCTAGECAPETVATGLDLPRAVEVAQREVFVGSGQKIFKYTLPGDGGLPPDLGEEVFTTNGEPRALLVDAANIYFVTNAQLGRRARDASGDNTQNIGGEGRGLALRNGRVYFTAGDGKVVSKKANDLSDNQDHASAQATPVGLVTTSTDVFWTVKDLGGIGKRALTGGAAPAYPISFQAFPNSLAGDESALYWTTSTDVRKSALPGLSKIDILATAQGKPISLVLSGPFVYWLDASNGAIRRVSTTPGSTTLTLHTGSGEALTGGTDHTDLLAVDGPWVYWVSPTTNTLKRVAK